MTDTALLSQQSEQMTFEAWERLHQAHVAEQVREGMARKIASGVLPCCAPIGYRNYQKKIEIDPILAPVVRESFGRAAVSKLSLRELLAEMTANGLVSRLGNPLKIGPFWYMLNNPFYVGMVRWNGKLVQGAHDPLISKDIFDTAVSNLKSRAAASKK